MVKVEEAPGEFYWSTKLKTGKSKRSQNLYGQVYIAADLLKEIGWKPGHVLSIVIVDPKGNAPFKSIRVVPER